MPKSHEVLPRGAMSGAFRPHVRPGHPGGWPETPSQTAGPYVHIGLISQQAGLGTSQGSFGPVLTGPDTPGTRIRIQGRVLDGTGSPCRDVLLELWQANAAGRYNHEVDRQDDKALDPSFRGWGRTGTDFQTGLYRFDTVKPGPVAGRRGHSPMAPHVTLWLVARGINTGLFTRMYFADEAALNDKDPVLRMIEPAPRRATLIAARAPNAAPSDAEPPTYTFDIHLQGENETVFFDV